VAWPEGVTHVYDLPWNFVAAWQQAITILNWQENLPEEDMPPKSIWRDGDLLEAHFKKIKAKWRGKDEGEFDSPRGSFDDAIDGKFSVNIRNRLGDYVRESLNDPWDDFSDF
jgi:hypothetical protein